MQSNDFHASVSTRRVVASVETADARHGTQDIEALRASEAHLRALLVATSDIVFRMSADGTEVHLMSGPELSTQSRARTSDWLLKHIHPDDAPRVQALVARAIETRSKFEFENRIIFPDGTAGWMFSRAIPVLDANGEVEEWFGTATDITERKKMEESLRYADRRKDEFLATLAHELRNPLAPIRSSVQLLKSIETADPHIRKARDVIDRQVHHMVRLVDDLLEMSRITLGQVNLKHDRVSVRRVLTDALEAAGPMIESRRHVLTTELPPESLQLEGDGTRLSQVFQNLLNNAAKYTPNGGRISVHTQCIDGEVCVAVCDTGIGIPPELQHRVFERFTRVHPGDRIKTSGLGIGLALARQLVELHGGRIEVHSAGLNEGSEFRVYLPVLADSHTQVPQPAVTASDCLRGQRVLIVDDNRDAAESLAVLLELEGCDVRFAVDGEQGLHLLEEFEPRVVLLDIGMPEMDGYEVARHMRSTAQGREVTLIALTGWGQREDKRRAAEAGFDQHLTKPVDLTALMSVLTASTAGRATRA